MPDDRLALAVARMRSNVDGIQNQARGRELAQLLPDELRRTIALIRIVRARVGAASQDEVDGSPTWRDLELVAEVEAALPRSMDCCLAHAGDLETLWGAIDAGQLPVAVPARIIQRLLDQADPG